MTAEEANKTIAEYMGLTKVELIDDGHELQFIDPTFPEQWQHQAAYTIDLNKLIPVIEKAGLHFEVESHPDSSNKWAIEFSDGIDSAKFRGNDLTEIAALGIAKAIQGLQK